MENNTKLEEAIKNLCSALKKDEDYYYSWQSNIAMAFQDEYNRNSKKYKNSVDIHTISNNAAKYFLDLLINN